MLSEMILDIIQGGSTILFHPTGREDVIGINIVKGDRGIVSEVMVASSDEVDNDMVICEELSSMMEYLRD